MLKGRVSIHYASHCPHCVVLAASNKAMYPDPVSCHSCHWDKIPVKSNLRRGGFIWLTVGGYKPSRWQEPMAAGHFAIIVRKQRVNNAGHFPLPAQFGTRAHEVVLPTSVAGLSCSIKPFWKQSLRHTRGAFPW